MQHIVIADDGPTSRTQLRESLTAAGFSLSEATDGEALDRSCTGLPLLSIVDIDMPVRDGSDVCHRRSALGHPDNDIPITFQTSVHPHALEAAGGQMGAGLTKPVDCQQVLTAVRSLVPLSA